MKLQWIDEGGFSVRAKVDNGEYVVYYDDGLWAYTFPNDTRYRGFCTFGEAQQKCEEHFSLTQSQNSEKLGEQ